MNNLRALQNATKQKVSVLETITLHVKMAVFKVRVVFGDERRLAVPFLLRTEAMQGF